MSRHVRTVTLALAAALAMSAAPAAAQGAGIPDRIAGSSRYDTAAALSAHVFPTGARTAYLVNGSAYADAVSAGSLNPGFPDVDGPILLVPGSGTVPASVLAEIRRLAPTTVYAIGGPVAVSDAVLRSAAQGRATGRLAGRSRYETAAAVSRHAYPLGAYDGGHIAVVNSTPTVDGLLAGQLPGDTNVVLTPANGPLPAVEVTEIKRFQPQLVDVVGGTATVSDAVKTAAATIGGVAPADTYRFAGFTRYATSSEIADVAFPSSMAPSVAYIASGTGYPDILAASSLKDGPLLLVPVSGTLPPTVHNYLYAAHPAKVVAIGGSAAVSDGMLKSAQTAAARLW